MGEILSHTGCEAVKLRLFLRAATRGQKNTRKRRPAASVGSGGPLTWRTAASSRCVKLNISHRTRLHFSSLLMHNAQQNTYFGGFDFRSFLKTNNQTKNVTTFISNILI